MHYRILLMTIVTIFLSSHLALSDITIKPFDEGESVKEFSVFRKQLITALNHNNEEKLLGFIHKNISGGAGGPSGIEEFISFWDLNKSEKNFEPLRILLLELVNNGGGFLKTKYYNRFVSPYYYLNQWLALFLANFPKIIQFFVGFIPEWSESYPIFKSQSSS